MRRAIALQKQAAVKAAKESEVLKLTGEARDVFVHAVLNPEAPNKAARAAAKTLQASTSTGR
jgi:uncharacterized protein (DUF1778 family)